MTQNAARPMAQDEEVARAVCMELVSLRPWAENYAPVIAAALRDTRRATLLECARLVRVGDAALQRIEALIADEPEGH